MRIDLARSLRRIRPERWTGALLPRPTTELLFAESAPLLGSPLVLDTCVYLDVLEDALPPSAQALLRSRPVRHVSTVLGELTHLFGRLSSTPRNRPVFASLTAAITKIETRHVTAPSPATTLTAGILSGLVFRLGGFQKGQEVAALNDATIYVHALDCGHTVLTRNRNDFDRMNQLMPAGRVIFYKSS